LKDIKLEHDIADLGTMEEPIVETIISNEEYKEEEIESDDTSDDIISNNEIENVILVDEIMVDDEIDEKETNETEVILDTNTSVDEDMPNDTTKEDIHTINPDITDTTTTTSMEQNTTQDYIKETTEGVPADDENSNNDFGNELVFVETDEDGDGVYEFDALSVPPKDSDGEKPIIDEDDDVSNYPEKDIIHDIDTNSVEIDDDALDTENSTGGMDSLDHPIVEDELIDNDTTIGTYNDTTISETQNGINDDAHQTMLSSQDEDDVLEISPLQEESLTVLSNENTGTVEEDGDDSALVKENTTTPINTIQSNNVTESVEDNKTNTNIILEEPTQEYEDNIISSDDSTTTETASLEDIAEVIVHDASQIAQEIETMQDQQEMDTANTLEKLNDDISNQGINNHYQSDIINNDNVPNNNNIQTETSTPRKEAPKINLQEQIKTTTDFHQILEHVEPSEELESAPGSSIQEVLVQKTIQLTVQKILFAKNFLIKLSKKVTNKQIKDYSVNVWNGVKDFFMELFGNDDDAGGSSYSDDHELKDLQNKVWNQINKIDDTGINLDDFKDLRGIRNNEDVSNVNSDRIKNLQSKLWNKGDVFDSDDDDDVGILQDEIKQQKEDGEDKE